MLKKLSFIVIGQRPQKFVGQGKRQNIVIVKVILKSVIIALWDYNFELMLFKCILGNIFQILLAPGNWPFQTGSVR